MTTKTQTFDDGLGILETKGFLTKASVRPFRRHIECTFFGFIVSFVVGLMAFGIFGTHNAQLHRDDLDASKRCAAQTYAHKTCSPEDQRSFNVLKKAHDDVRDPILLLAAAVGTLAGLVAFDLSGKKKAARIPGQNP